MENKEMKDPILNELDEDALDNVSGGLFTVIVLSASGDNSDTGTDIMSGSMLR